MSDERQSMRPSSSQTQLIAAVLVALGLGTGGGSLLARGANPEALKAVLSARSERQDATYANKIEVAQLSGELALVRQELEQATELLAHMSLQLTKLEENMRPVRRR